MLGRNEVDYPWTPHYRTTLPSNRRCGCGFGFGSTSSLISNPPQLFPNNSLTLKHPLPCHVSHSYTFLFTISNSNQHPTPNTHMYYICQILGVLIKISFSFYYFLYFNQILVGLIWAIPCGIIHHHTTWDSKIIQFSILFS